MTLGRAARLLGLHPQTLRRRLDQQGAGGFEIFERKSANGKRLRYLRADEIRRAMGHVDKEEQ
ncbi:hypothetical protein HOI71_03915 [Candidatus Poribacteria bacterium]|nr:hypothetical protein [Candidatus Poribacteria bacterium]